MTFASARAIPKSSDLVADYLEWEKHKIPSVLTARVLLGQFHYLYKQRYRLFPHTRPFEDIRHFQWLLEYCEDQPLLASGVIRAAFENQRLDVNARMFSNPNVITGWRLIERAARVFGERAEFAGIMTPSIVRV